MTRSTLLWGALALSTTALACASPPRVTEARRELDAGLAQFARRDLAALDERLNRLIAETQSHAGPQARQRFFAAWLLAQAHARAAHLAPFRPDVDAERGVTSHLVSTIYHANQALAWRTAAEADREAPSPDVEPVAQQGTEPGAQADSSPLVPELLANQGVARAAANLEVLIAISYARLGMAERASRTLDELPWLTDPASCLPSLEELLVPTELSPWVTRLVFEHLRTRDEERAYRFAILSVEGRTRFGHGLPRTEIERLESWILDGASVRFVCPRSQSPYLPGETHSPISGVAHYDYVPVERR